MARARLLPAALLITVAAAAAGACGTTDSNSGASPPTTGVTVTTTVAPAPTSPAPQNPQSPGSAAPTAPPQGGATTAPNQADPTSVVNDYFTAINAQDYARAWALGGKHLDSSYSSFVNGFADTSADVVRILSTGPSSVTLHLDAVQDDGSVKSFEGTYTVAGGEITRASVHAVAAAQPPGGTTPSGSRPGGGTDTSTQPGGGSSTDTGARYDNCTEAHADGATSIPRNDPRYHPSLDRDQDGRACEPHESPTP